MKNLLLTLSLALRNLGRQRQRTLSTLAAIVIGLVGLAFLDGFITYSMSGLKEVIVHGGTGHLQIASSAESFDQGDNDPFPYLMPGAKDLTKELLKNPAVKDVVPSLNFTAVLSLGGKMQTVQVKALPTQQRLDNMTMVTLKTGTELDPGTPGRILVGAGLATKLGLKPGSATTVFALGSGGNVNNQPFTVAGVYSTGIAAADTVTVFMDLSDAQALAETSSVTLLTVFLENTGDTDAVLAGLKAHPPKDEAPGTEIRAWSTLSPYWQQANGSYQMVLGVSRIIVLLVALFSISGALNLSVLERLREIGTLRAFGNRRGQVVRLLLAEGLFLGILGALTGTLAGWLFTTVANAAGGMTMPPQPGMSTAITILFQPDPGHYLSNALWVTAASVVGAWFPAHFAVQKLPADLLRSV